MTTTKPLPHLLTIEELADHLGVTVRHIRRLIAEQRVPYVKWRRFIRFDPDEIACWLDDARHPQRPDEDRAALAPPAGTRH
ncbi:MAG: helix-turn-helix domain-containing protein [Acidimicrobiales bacterium]|jgi:excisionase family DNA binding protein